MHADLPKVRIAHVNVDPRIIARDEFFEAYRLTDSDFFGKDNCSNASSHRSAASCQIQDRTSVAGAGSLGSAKPDPPNAPEQSAASKC
jgi:hypothetical protein